MRFYPEQKNTRLRAASGAEGRAIRARYVTTGSPRAIRFRKASARALRVGLKALAGGYSGSELVRHGATILGRGTWEQQEAARQHRDR